MQGFGASLGTAPGHPHQFGEVIRPMYIECPEADVSLDFTAVIESTTSGVYQQIVSLYGF